MNRIIKYITFTFLLTFLFIFNVKAECSYQERKDLLNAAKNVDVFVSPKAVTKKITGTNSFDEEIEFEYEEYSYDFTIANLSNDLYIKYYDDMTGIEKYINKEKLTNGVYIFNNNNDDNIINYIFEIRTSNNNCSGDVIYTKRVKKPIYNILSSFRECQEEALKGSKYCEKFITEEINISDNEFRKYANKLIESEKDIEMDNVNIKEIIFDNWYWFLIIGFVIFIIVLIFIRHKKRGEL